VKSGHHNFLIIYILIKYATTASVADKMVVSFLKIAYCCCDYIVILNHSFGLVHCKLNYLSIKEFRVLFFFAVPLTPQVTSFFRLRTFRAMSLEKTSDLW